ncbi:DUF4352 domain-containing protein [Actinomadura sp. 1N219]|uniref:DUF4352 domain-containing protein n=1 Tax=Actinomadura sp. 1N219 TaxID=3375152 RepID=UPI0037B031BF
MKKIAALIALGVGLALAGCAIPAEEPVAVQSAEAKGATGKASKKAKPPIGLTAKRTTAKRSILSDGGALSCVKVTVRNQGKKVVNVNPLYFAITDTGGTKHDAGSALGMYENQIETMDIAPGEKATGTVCASGKFRPKTVSMTNELLSTAARAAVAS